MKQIIAIALTNMILVYVKLCKLSTKYLATESIQYSLELEKYELFEFNELCIDYKQLIESDSFTG